jgi:hypothetical protein
MASWWHRDVVAAGKLPLMLCFLAFVVTFVLTRTITRMIRDGRGPFRNQMTASGTHIHHSVPGIILLIIGAFTAVGGPGSLGALRLARPSSIWARHRYRGERLQRATRRAADFDRRWAPLQTGWEDFVGGKPSQPNPPASDEVHG